MKILNTKLVDEFSKKHALSRKPLQTWVKTTTEAKWSSFAEVKQTFNSVDYKNGVYIFDIKGNSYRLLTKVIFQAQIVSITNVLTHAEYNKLNL